MKECALTARQAAPVEDQGVARWCVYIENAIDSGPHLERALPTHARGDDEAARDQREIASIPNEAATNEQSLIVLVRG